MRLKLAGFIPYNAKELISFFLKAKEKYWQLNYSRKGIPATILFPKYF